MVRYGFVLIPGYDDVPVDIPEVEEGWKYQPFRCWQDHDVFKSTLDLVQVVNQKFLDKFGRLPSIGFDQNDIVVIEGISTYATPAITFWYDEE